MIHGVCPHCHTVFSHPGSLLDKETVCQNCNKTYLIIESPPHYTYPPLGRIALDNKLVTEEQLREALRVKTRWETEGHYHPLDEVLYELKFISLEKYQRLFFATVRTLGKEFGSIACKNGFISQHDLDQALALQAEEFKKSRLLQIGSILLNSNRITKEQYDLIMLGYQNRADFQKDLEKKLTENRKKPGSGSQKAYKENSLKTIRDTTSIEGVLNLQYVESDKIRNKILNHVMQKSDDLFCKAVLEKQFITEDQLQEARKIQKKEMKRGRIKLIQDILMDEYQLEPSVLKEILLKIKQENQEPVEENQNISIVISEDTLTATLILPQPLSGKVTLKKVHDLLTDKGVSFGIIPDTEISAFLSSKHDQDTSIKIAMGVSPVQGQNAEVIFYFKTEYLKAGRINPDGSIDFNDRGDIPFVHENDVLAQKKPLVPGTPGKDVFGNDIPASDVKDCLFIAGKGTSYGKDKLEIVAAIDGSPEAGLGDTISVYKDYQVRGDVSLETGHITFDGNVLITGSVTPKFRVSCVNITANEVVGARIDATGDVNISNGIIDSVIRARGNIQAKFISNSHVETFGDLVVTKEILDSDIMISGTCINKNGNIMFSRISARTGFDICNLGTDMSKPSVVKTGSDDHITSQLERIDRLIDDNQLLMLSLKDEFKKQEKKQILIHHEITDSVFLQEKLSRKIKETGNKEDTTEKLRTKLSELEKTIDHLFTRQEQLDSEIETISSRVKEKENRIQELQDKKSVIHDWADNHPVRSNVKIRGTGLEKETIISPSATLVLTEDIKNKEILEITSEDLTCHLKII